MKIEVGQKESYRVISWRGPFGPLFFDIQSDKNSIFKKTVRKIVLTKEMIGSFLLKMKKQEFTEITVVF